MAENDEVFVVIESNETLIDKIREETRLLYIHGDAAQEDVLAESRIDKAKAMITTLPNDADNLSSCFAGKSIRELDVRNVSGANIIGLKKKDKSYIINPEPGVVLTTEDQLFVLGTVEQINKVKEIIDFG